MFDSFAELPEAFADFVRDNGKSISKGVDGLANVLQAQGNEALKNVEANVKANSTKKAVKVLKDAMGVAKDLTEMGFTVTFQPDAWATKTLGMDVTAPSKPQPTNP